jgi:hypothetical protein
MVNISDPTASALDAANTFIAKWKTDVAAPDRTLGTRKENIRESGSGDEKVAKSLRQEFIKQLEATGPDRTLGALEQARHRRFVLIMALSGAFLVAVLIISFFARDSVALALFGNGGVCVAFIGFLNFAMSEQTEERRLEINANLVAAFTRMIGLVDNPDDLVRITEAFRGMLMAPAMNPKPISRSARRK